MPHQCVRCNNFYEDGDKIILSGCPCGGKLFFYIKKEKIAELKNKTASLSEEQRKEIETDVFDLVGSEIDRDEPVVLDIESIRVLEPGKYELDLVHLFKKDPLIFKLEEGKYMIDILQTFKQFVGNKGKDKEKGK
jgi:predicted  nucleic acid-binding Zn-ribbon protein